ncbi:MAG TPA: caspase family protein [Vicinamibacterales bacterium]|nr:caspase family protein [Vicinamibacterales bacterium]
MARRALLVGINRYPDPAHRLRGCVNDVRQLRGVLRDNYGFDRPDSLAVLVDEAATTAAIRGELARLTTRARAGDILVFHYSGHGSQVPDTTGDETTDGLDEILCPYDLDWNDPLTDDDLAVVVQALPAGAHLAVVLDCCHSGTGLRGPAPGAHPPRRKCLAGPGRAGGGGRARRFGEQAVAAGAVLLAGCRANQTSADAFIGGAYQGAHTWALCRVLGAHAFQASYERLVGDMRLLLRNGGFPQVPQLEGPRAARSGFVFGGVPGALAAS